MGADHKNTSASTPKVLAVHVQKTNLDYLLLLLLKLWGSGFGRQEFVR